VALTSGGRDLLEKLKNDTKLTENNSARQGLEEMSLLFNYLDALDASTHVFPTPTYLT
jgi:histidyl-tRNA synthetase